MSDELTPDELAVKLDELINEAVTSADFKILEPTGKGPAPDSRKAKNLPKAGKKPAGKPMKASKKGGGFTPMF